MVLMLSSLKEHEKHVILLNMYEKDSGLYHIFSEWVTFYVIRAKINIHNVKLSMQVLSFKIVYNVSIYQE